MSILYAHPPFLCKHPQRGGGDTAPYGTHPRSRGRCLTGPSRSSEPAKRCFCRSFPGWKEPKIPGDRLRGVQALQSPAPGPRYGGRLPGAVPRIRRGRCSRLPPLPRRCRWLGNPKKQSGWTEKARLVQAAVGAGPDTAGGWYPPLPPTRQPLRRGRCPHRPAVNCPAKQHGTGQAAPVGAAGPILRHARAQWPGRRGTRHSNFARRTGFPAKGAAKNGVLVPLPPWAKEPAAGAAELPKNK